MRLLKLHSGRGGNSLHLLRLLLLVLPSSWELLLLLLELNTSRSVARLWLGVLAGGGRLLMLRGAVCWWVLILLLELLRHHCTKRRQGNLKY